MKIWKREFLISLIILSMIFSACNNDREQIPDKIEIETLQVNTISDIFLNPKFVAKHGENLLLFENGLSNDFFKIISRNDFSIIDSFGVEGEGPGEFSGTISFPISGTEKNYTSLYDWSKKRVNRISLDNNKGYKINKSYNLPQELFLSQRATFLNDTTVIASGGIHSGLISFVNTESNSIKYFNPHGNLTNENMGKRDIYELFFSEFAVNNEKERIVAASNFIPEIFILDYDGKILNKFRYEDFDFQNIVEQSPQERRVYYQSFGATENYFYSVFVDKSGTEMGRILEKNTNPEKITEVHVFDWNGNLQRKFELDKGYHPYITVDEENGRILSVDRFNNNAILSFESEFIK